MFEDLLADDGLGMKTKRKDDKILLSYPIAILAADVLTSIVQIGDGRERDRDQFLRAIGPAIHLCLDDGEQAAGLHHLGAAGEPVADRRRRPD